MAEPGVRQSRLALLWLIVGEWRWHPARFVSTSIAIAVGVALGFAVHLVNGSALASFEQAVSGVNGAADLRIDGRTPFGFSEDIYPKAMGAPGVADVSPVVKLDARIGDQRLVLLGLDAIRAANVTPMLVGVPPSSANARQDQIFAADALFLSQAVIHASRARIGERVRVIANGRSASFTVAGILPGAPADQAIGTIDIAAAQWRFGRIGTLDRLDLKLDDRSTARAALGSWLPKEVVIASDETEARQGDTLSRAYRVNLDMLALVALLTGGFLVFSAQSLSVARRMRAFALLRTLGLPRSGIVAAVTLEGIMIGTIGACLGLGLGYGMAKFALSVFGGDLGGGYFQHGAAHLALQPQAAGIFFLLGVMAAVLGSVLPARAAARAAPAAALKNSGDALDPRAPVPWRPAILLLGLGGGCALLPAVDGLPVFGFVSMALILAGGIAGVPWLIRQLLKPWRTRGLSRPTIMLALRHVQGAPGQAAIALCGIVASTSLMIAMATMVSSFRLAVDSWLTEILSADLYLRDEAVGFSPSLQRKIAQTSGVANVSFSLQLPLTMVSDKPPVQLIARPIGTGGAAPPLTMLDQAPRTTTAIPIWVSEPAQRIYHWKTGQILALTIGTRQRPFQIVGIWRDYARQQGAIAIQDSDFGRLTGERSRSEAAILLSPGADALAVRRRLARLLSPSASVAEPRLLQKRALELFDRSFAITYILEAVATLVGLAGVAATMSAQTIARTKEFGMLRHIGLTKRQIVTLLGIEGALLGLVGAIAGVALGALLGQVLIQVINPQSFNWTMATHWPVGIIATVIAALVASAALTAMVAGRRATAKDVVVAVREDW
jgi:putative ABC transport system permease protein